MSSDLSFTLTLLLLVAAALKFELIFDAILMMEVLALVTLTRIQTVLENELAT